MAVPFKNGADIYNNEVLRMRLHNLGADPTEVGAGLIYFNTSNGLNTSKKARIYTGDAWKTFAFMEDLDVASNADFIALQEKVALLAGDVDTDAIISNMKEVSAFLEGFAEDASLMDLLKSKLSTSGGTMTGDLIMGKGHVVTRECYASADNTYNLGSTSRRWANLYTMLINGGTPIHSGNIGSYKAGDSDMLGGRTLAWVQGNGRKILRVKTATSTSPADANVDLEGGGMIYSYSNTSHLANGPTGMGFGHIWQVGSYGNNVLDGQFAWDNNHNSQEDTTGKLWWRSRDSVNGWTYAKWHQIAFTDSNVAGATKLVYTDGIEAAHAGANGHLYVQSNLYFDKNTRYIYGRLADGTSRAMILGVNANDALLIGYGLMTKGNTYIYGNEMLFATGGEFGRMFINSSGNVTIGATDKLTNSATTKLYVDGGIRFAPRTIWGRSFDGTADITLGAQMQLLYLKHRDGTTMSWFGRGSEASDTISVNVVGANGFSVNTNGAQRMLINPSGNVTIGASDLAKENYKLVVSGKGYFADNLVAMQLIEGHGDMTILGNVGIGTTNPTEKLHVVGNLHVTGNIIADGEVSAGGAGEEGSASGSGAGAFHSESIAVGATQKTIAHGLGTDDIVVSIYEKDATSGLWSMILTDIEITDADNIRVTFGSATTVEHKVVIMGAVA